MKIKEYFSALDKIVLWGSGLFVFTSFLLYYLIDLRNFLGSRDLLFNTEGVYFYFSYVPFFFQHYGKNGGFAEIVQWSLLATAVLLALFYAGKFFETKRDLSMFWLIFGVGMMFMLLEDAGDVRHVFMGYVQWIAGEPDQGIFGTLFEALYFLFLGGIPLYAFFRYRNVIKEEGRVFVYMLTGMVLYAVAATVSFVGTAFQMYMNVDVYSAVGTWFKAFSLKIADPEVEYLWETWDANNWLMQVDFHLMDSLFEENIEVMAGAFFLAAVLSVFKLYIHSPKNCKK